MSWDELRIHRWIQRSFESKGLRGGRGHDAASLVRSLERPVACVDQTVRGVHFTPEAPPGAVGHKACARALSDLAASAAEPVAVLAALALPGNVSEPWIQAVLRSVARTAERHGAVLAGGDLSSSGPPGSGAGAVLTVTAIGAGPSRGPNRARARPGQLIVVTGPTGGSALGRHLRFEPRCAAGRALVEAGARCMMDTTDGLAFDLSRLAEASGVRMVVDGPAIHPDARRLARRGGRTALDRALHDGEDYELLATLSAPAWRRAASHPALAEAAVIGRVSSGAGLYVPDREPLEEARSTRWRHGAGRGWSHGG